MNLLQRAAAWAHPVSSNESIPMSRQSPQFISLNAVFGIRLVLAATVAAYTCAMWLVFWVVGASAQGLTELFSNHAPRPTAQRFGDIWQWAVAGLTLLLVIALPASSRHTRTLAIAWLAGLTLLAVAGLRAFGAGDSPALNLVLWVFAPAVLYLIHRVAPRAAYPAPEAGGRGQVT